MLTIIGCCAALLAAANRLEAQSRDTTDRPRGKRAAAPPACCRIARIDRERGIVTARETSTGYTFAFEVRNRRLLATLAVGDGVWASFATKAVRLRPGDTAACCAIIDSLLPP